MWSSACLAMWLGAGAHADPGLRVPIPLPGPWEARRDGDEAWSSPPDPRGWRHTPAWRGVSVGWFRTTARIAAREGEEPSIVVFSGGAWEAWVDGVRVGGGGVPGERLAGFSPRVLAIPPDALGDDELELVVRVWAPRAYSPWGAQGVGATIGDRPALTAEVAALQRQLVLDRAGPGIEGLLSILIGVAHLALFARRRTLRAHLWFGVATVAQGAWSLLAFWTWGGLGYPFLGLHVVLPILQNISFGGLVLFGAHFFGTGHRVARVLAPALLIVGVSRVALIPESRLLTGFFTWGLVAPALVYTAWVARHGLAKGVVGARLVAGGLALFLVWPVAIGALAVGALDQVWLEPVRQFATLSLTIAMVLGLAEQFTRTQEDLERTLRAARWFVPFEVLSLLGRPHLRDVRRGDATRREMTMLFLDVRGFTSLAEQHPAEAVFAFVNALFDHLEPHLRRNGGFVIQFTGDGFLALFPDADGAVQAAADQLRALECFRPPLAPDGVRVGIGLHTGPIVLGTIGGADQLLAGVVADAANLAARVEGMTKLYRAPVLLTDATRDRLAAPERFVLREIDLVVAVGRRESIGICELRDRPGDPRFEVGWRAYRAGAFAEAQVAFAACEEDGAAAVLAERCRQLVAAPPVGWDGVWRLTTK